MSATSKRDRAIRDGLEPATGKDHPDIKAIQSESGEVMFDPSHVVSDEEAAAAVEETPDEQS